MSEHCGATTEEGNAVCIPGSRSCSSESKKDEQAASSVSPMDSQRSSILTRLNMLFSIKPNKEKTHVEESS